MPMFRVTFIDGLELTLVAKSRENALAIASAVRGDGPRQIVQVESPITIAASNCTPTVEVRPFTERRADPRRNLPSKGRWPQRFRAGPYQTK
jgi:hypothetical protein